MKSTDPQAPAGHTNNFDAIRVAAALAVLVSHHFALTGQIEPSFLGLHSWGGLGVHIFFVISGYLVTASWYNDPHFLRFSLRRILRIWPALTVVVVITAFCLGAWVTNLPLRAYWVNRATFDYLLILKMQMQHVLPGVFESNPYARGVNGSLWTIPLEVHCYIAMALAGLLGLMRWRKVWLLLIAGYMVWFLARSNPDLMGGINYDTDLGAFFLAGSALFLLQRFWERRPLLSLIALSGCAALLWLVRWHYTALLVLLPFLVVYAGTRSTPVIRRFARWGDPSYGIYLIAFPVQQTVIHFLWPRLGFAATMALAIVITVTLAYTSWHLVEKKALKLKPRKSGRGTLPFYATGSERSGWRRWALSIWPLMACALGWRYIFLRLDAPVLYDPEHNYFPAAYAVLDQGWSFLLTPESYRVVPLAYLWPALWGVDPTWIRIANMGLWAGCVWFVWRACLLLGGVRAGVVGMLLMLYPELMRYFPSEMTEPLFLFGLFGWLYAMASIVIDSASSRRVVALAAVMLTITLLSRPLLQLLAPATLAVCLAVLALWAVRPGAAPDADVRRTLRTLAWSLGLGLIVPGLLVLKNGWVFGLWGLGTGAGAGLYQGTHPLFQGAEPVFMGFGYDVTTLSGAATGMPNHFDLASDRFLRATGLWQIQSMPPGEFFAYFGRKLGWWLIHHPAEIQYHGSVLRKLRLFELLVIVWTAVMALAAWRWRGTATSYARWAWAQTSARQRGFAAFVLVFFLMMLAQLLPILYNSRYSVALLDPWLLLLTSLGVAVLTAPLQPTLRLQRDGWAAGIASRQGIALWKPVAALAAVVALPFVLYKHGLDPGPIVIDPGHTGQVAVRWQSSDPSAVTAQGAQQGQDGWWQLAQSPAALLVAIDPADIGDARDRVLFNPIWDTPVAVSVPASSRCKYVELTYQTQAGAVLHPAYSLPWMLPVTADGQPHRLLSPATSELYPRAPGYYRMAFHCPTGTRIRWAGTRLLESLYPDEVLSHVRH